MAVTENTSGNTTTDGTEQTLATISTAGNYQLRLSINNLANDDAIEIRIKVEPRSSSATPEVLYLIALKHDQGEQSIIESPWIAIPASSQVVFTLKRTAGTDRSYEWSILTQ